MRVFNKKIKHQKLLLITIGLGILLNPLNSSMISVALVRLQEHFSLDFASTSWLISTYYLASAISQPVMGKLSDLFGYKRVFLIGMVLVAMSSLIAPLAPTFGWLIVFRLIQATGSGAIYPAGMAIARKYFNKNKARTLAIISIFSSSAAAIGPSIGGFLIFWSDWPSIFLINIPIIIINFCLAFTFLPKDTNNSQRFKNISLLKQLDLFGIITFVFFIIFSLFFILSIEQNIYWFIAILALISFILFVIREFKTSHPFIDLKVFHNNRTLTWIHIQFLTTNAVFYSTYFGFPIYLQSIRGFNIQHTGLLMFCMSGMSIIISPLAGILIERIRLRPVLIISTLFLTFASALLLMWNEHTSIPWLIFALCLFGVSDGFNNVGLQVALYELAPVNIIGTVTGLFMTTRYCGTILSTLLLTMVIGNEIQVTGIINLSTILIVLSILILYMSFKIPKKL